MMYMRKVGVSHSTKLETKLQVGQAILNTEVEGCLALSSCPDMDHLLQAGKKESFFSDIEGGAGVDLVHFVKRFQEGKITFAIASLKLSESKMADTNSTNMCRFGLVYTVY